MSAVNEEYLFKVILSPHISEKASLLADSQRQYVFKVHKESTKPDIKKAVEFLFNVEVENVQVCNTKGKVKRFKQTLGKRKGYRKAYVKLKEGHEIQFMSGE